MKKKFPKTRAVTRFGSDSSYPRAGIHVVKAKGGGRVMKAPPRHRGGGGGRRKKDMAL